MDSNYELDIETARHCRQCLETINKDLFNSKEGKEFFKGGSDLQDKSEEMIDYITAMIDSGVYTIVIPDALRDTYDKMLVLTIRLTILSFLSLGK